MCGICGIVYKDPARQPDRHVLKQMCDSIVHRGPDEEGQEILGPAGLGMRRLSIIDLNTGRQPISNEDGTLWIVFNGEIYNFPSLRKDLESMGHRFKTHTDTETILHGFEAWGNDVCRHLNGMFGFAIWDTQNRTLFLARDRIGIKPLYYYEDNEKWVFGSEMKAILRCPDIHKSIDTLALNHFMMFEYIPSPESIFQEIRKLPPGHTMTIRADQKKIEPYWSLKPGEVPRSEAEAVEQLRELVRDSVKLRLISDVPLGAFLSGGIDSSIVVSQMAALVDQPVKTFSIGFEASSYNELKYARAVASKYGTDHHEFTIRPDALTLTEKLVGQLDEPLGDFSIFPTYLVSKMARDHVTVCLSGDGGDELFAGYDTYRAHRFDRRFYHRLPKIVKNQMIQPFARALPPTAKKKGMINSFKRFVEGTQLPKDLYHVRWMTFLQDEERRALFTPELYYAGDPFEFIYRYSRFADNADDIARMGFIDVNTYLVDNILVKVDRMSMTPSLEARVPLLDHRIVEFSFSLPARYKMRGLRTKYLLKKAFWKDFPVEVQKRDKQGFSIPIKNWIRNELKPMMQDLLDEKRIRAQGIFKSDTVSRLVKEHCQGIENHSHKLWALMVFQYWHDLYA